MIGFAICFWFTAAYIFVKLNPFNFNDRLFFKLLIWFVLIITSLGLLGYAVVGISQYSAVKSVASAISPDGQLQATYVQISWVDASFDLVINKNEPKPIIAHSLGGLHFGGPGPKEEPEVLWSPDSKLVSVWYGGKAYFAYDFRSQVPLSHDQLLELNKNALSAP